MVLRSSNRFICRRDCYSSRTVLGKTREELENEAREVLEGHLRSILGSMTVEEIYQNRDKFSQSVQEVASVDLAKWG